MIKHLDEGNLHFEFLSFLSAERFDSKELNVFGMKSVDFVAEDTDCLYFIEVKDYQHPNTTENRRKLDFETLIAAVESKKSIFTVEMGAKIKDSLLRKYSLGEQINKKIVFLLFINLDKFGEFERGRLLAKISGHIPTGLNDARFPAFTSISFDLVNAVQLKNYGITCTEKAKG